MQMGSLEVALDCFNKSIQLDGANATAWMSKGQALSGMERHDDALSAYNESIKLDANLAEAWYGKGLAFAHLGRYNESIASL